MAPTDNSAIRNNYEYSLNDLVKQKFTGQMRDGETGLDYSGLRYYGPAMGRFMQADQPLNDQHPWDPQSWNLYGYVRNNPLINIDPTGLCSQDANGGYYDHDQGQTYLFYGPCSGGQIGGTEAGDNSVTVGAQLGSWFDYFLATLFNQIPRDYSNDVPLNQTAVAIFRQVYANTWPIAQPLCSGGGFVYAGVKEGRKGTLHGEALVIPVEAESGKGISSGALLEGGVGHGAAGGSLGVEFGYNWSTKSLDASALAFANKDIGGLSLGPVSVGGLADNRGNIGAYAGMVVGIGVYGRPSFINGCR